MNKSPDPLVLADDPSVFDQMYHLKYFHNLSYFNWFYSKKSGSNWDNTSSWLATLSRWQSRLICRLCSILRLRCPIPIPFTTPGCQATECIPRHTGAGGYFITQHWCWIFLALQTSQTEEKHEVAWHSSFDMLRPSPPYHNQDTMGSVKDYHCSLSLDLLLLMVPHILQGQSQLWGLVRAFSSFLVTNSRSSPPTTLFPLTFWTNLNNRYLKMKNLFSTLLHNPLAVHSQAEFLQARNPDQSWQDVCTSQQSQILCLESLPFGYVPSSLGITCEWLL